MMYIKYSELEKLMNDIKSDGFNEILDIDVVHDDDENIDFLTVSAFDKEYNMFVDYDEIDETEFNPSV